MLWHKLNKFAQTTETTKRSTKTLGDSWELYAEHYLIDNGLSLLTKNFHSRQGEIDLIMKDDDCLVFVEVKYRKNNHFGGAISAVTQQKQQKIIKTAIFYLQQQNLNEYNTACRFDIVAIEGDTNNPTIHWLKNAFS
ncbi:YraN family protein [Colwellia sp. 1_MG-2023]|uniref:YraN family protein n=1 Tax=Colwellia sp. 1_MG-2023 TaxID=3062649 RepID=UPI0026E30685|nr:YraN family protein [Colwellia sp. 1_MG-2023]MDO6444860.1 YraN family protein [Colwellia sp. 1_MG-2023]